MGTLQNLFNRQPQANPVNKILNSMQPQQRNTAFQFLSLPKEKQAQQIADWCNQKGITKEQLQSFINNLKI